MHDLDIFLHSLTAANLVELNQTEAGRMLLASIANLGDSGISKLLSTQCRELVRRLPEYVGEEGLKQYLNKDVNIKKLLSSHCTLLIMKLPEYVGKERLKRYFSIDTNISSLLSSHCTPFIKRLPEYIEEERFKQYLSTDRNISRLLSSHSSPLIRAVPEYIGGERFKQYLRTDANIKKLFSSQCTALIKRLPQYVDEKRLQPHRRPLVTKRKHVYTIRMPVGCLEGGEQKNLDCKNYMGNTICFFSFTSPEQLSTVQTQNNTRPLDLAMS